MKIKDVVYGEIDVTEPLIEELIATPEFQRLRRIKQLGVTDFIFPSAVHNRLIHSIGVYNVVKKMVEQIEARDPGSFSEDEIIAVKVAGLLHDLGHGPLSHTAETFFDFSHEDYTIKILQNEEGHIYRILKDYEIEEASPGLLDSVVQLINKDHPNKALNSLISSSLDADRIDYLVRDSYFTGVVYGKVDIDRILSGLKYNEGEIVFLEKSLHTLEDFILSRYHMFVQVYLNTKSIFYEELLSKILKRVMVLKQTGYEFAVDITIFEELNEKPIRVENYVKIDDYNFTSTLNALSGENDEELRRLINIFQSQTLFKDGKVFGHATDETYFLEVKSQSKKVYKASEPIRILQSDGEVVNAEDISPMFKFAEKDLRIETKDQFLYLEEK